MEVKKIGPEFAQELGCLEAEIYPPRFCLGWRDFLEDLKEAEEEKGNFSFGIFEGDRMMGYIVAYRDEDEIFVSDLAILPAHRAGGKVAALLAKFLQAVSLTQSSFYAECRKNSFGLCSKHPEFFRKFGFVLSENKPVSPYGDEPSWEIRFEYVG